MWRPRGSSTPYFRRFSQEGGLEIREVCTYQFDSAMGLGYVPKTVWREESGEFGSLQRWLPDSFREWERTDDESDIRRPSFPVVGKQRAIELWLLDTVLMNVDSVHTNYLWSEQTQGVARVDNGECLPRPDMVSRARSLPVEHASDGCNWPLSWWRDRLGDCVVPGDLLERLRTLDWDSLRRQWCAVGLEPDAAAAAEDRARSVLDLGRADTESVWDLPDSYNA